MKKIFTLFSICFICLCSSAQTGSGFYSFSDTILNGNLLSMSQFAGKKVMVVNTASYCGYTYEYGLLQELDSLYGQYNFAVIGFPSNDFFQGGNDSQIVAVCHSYHVSFPIMNPIHVVSGNIDPLFQWLTT